MQVGDFPRGNCIGTSASKQVRLNRPVAGAGPAMFTESRSGVKPVRAVPQDEVRLNSNTTALSESGQAMVTLFGSFAHGNEAP